MAKTYNYNDFKKDPRTAPNSIPPRYITAIFDCIDSNHKTLAEIFTAIDKAYFTGHHRSPSYIKNMKKKAARLMAMFTYE